MKAFFIGAGASKGTFHSTGTPVPAAAEFGKALQDIDPQMVHSLPSPLRNSRIISVFLLTIGAWSRSGLAWITTRSSKRLFQIRYLGLANTLAAR